MNAESATNILDKLVQEQRGEPLNRLQRAIIQGVLDGLTYQEIKNNYAIARNYQICYLARYVAYHLWKLLTEVLKDAGIIDPDERVRNKNLWESAMRVAQQSVQSESVQKSQPPVPPLNCIFRSPINNPLPLSSSPPFPFSPSPVLPLSSSPSLSLSRDWRLQNFCLFLDYNFLQNIL